MTKNHVSSWRWVNALLMAGILVCLAVLILQNIVRLSQRSPAPESVVMEVMPSPAEPVPDPKPAPPPRQALAATTVPVETPAHQPGDGVPTALASPPPPPLFQEPVPVLGHILKGPATTTANSSSTAWPAGVGAEIIGRVRLNGTPPEERTLPLDPYCSKYYTNGLPTTRFYVVGEDHGLGDVLVHVHDVRLNGQFVIPAEPVTLAADRCLFHPYVLGIQTGQTLQLLNLGPVLENFHITARTNREINYAMMPVQRGRGILVPPPRPEQGARSLVFNHEELFVRAKCDTHPWQFADIAVLPHPFFSVTDTNGYFEMRSGLPVGEYELVAHHRKAGVQRQRVTVREAEPVEVEFTFTVPGQQATR